MRGRVVCSQISAFPLWGPWPYFENWYRSLWLPTFWPGAGGSGNGNYCEGGEIGELPGGSLGCAPRFCDVWEQSVACSFQFYSWPSICFEIFYSRSPEISGIFPSLDRLSKGNTALKGNVAAELTQ